MKKPTLIKTLITTLLLTSSISAIASEAKFQVAVVKGAIGSVDIAKGELASSIEKLTTAQKSKDFYANKMNLCVAYLQSNNSEKSESACTDAISSLESLPSANSKVRYLTSLTYSNRGVARYRKNQLDAALTDFKFAATLDENPITERNLAKIRRILPAVKVEDVAILSD
ncbi:MAG: hypothetical protein WBC60_09885 [Cognaticolwellia sp.]